MYLIYSGHRLDNSYASYELGLGVTGVIERKYRPPLRPDAAPKQEIPLERLTPQLLARHAG